MLKTLILQAFLVYLRLFVLGIMAAIFITPVVVVSKWIM